MLPKGAGMETATVILDGDCQIVRLPKCVHLPENVFVRHRGVEKAQDPAKERQKVERFVSAIML